MSVPRNGTRMVQELVGQSGRINTIISSTVGLFLQLSGFVRNP